MTMWLSLPGAAMCSIPVGMGIVPRLLSATGTTIPIALPNFWMGALLFAVLTPIAAIMSRKAYKHCISSTGLPGTRMVLMIFNFITGGIAALTIVLFVIGVVFTLLRVIVTAGRYQ
jgi:hypothetical protein